MAWLKRLEIWAKLVSTAVLALLLWRPGRKARAAQRLPGARRLLLVRLDNRVGEALLTTPLFTALKARSPALEVHALVHPKVARVLEGHPAIDRLIPFDRRRLWLGPLSPGLQPLRHADYDAVVDCSNWTAPSGTSAILSRLAAPRAVVVGPDRAPTRWLADVAIPARPDTRRETLQRGHLLSWVPGLVPEERLSFRPPRVDAAFQHYLRQIRPGTHAVVNPGGRLGERRIPPQAFAAAARALLEAGRIPIVTWGPNEEALADEVLAHAPGALRAPPTDIDQLAALMQAAGLTVCNNTGPMHLSVAVGAPTLGLFYRIDMERWGHPFPPHRMVDLTPWASAPETLAARAAEEARAFAATLARAPA